MKILIIGDIHIGDSKEATFRSGIVRQANPQAEETLTALIPRFNRYKFDLVVHTGDALCHTLIKEIDQDNTIKTLELLNQINAPKIHIIGNHELKAFGQKEIHDVYKKAGVVPEFFGVQEFDNLRVIWLDIESDESNHSFLPKERINWLKSLTPSSKVTIVLTHHSLVPIDASGSFYFEDQSKRMYLGNADLAVKAMQHLDPKICINGHVHLLTQQIVGQTQYISAPSFTENITAENYPNNNPGIFSILDIDENEFVFTVYSGNFCFSKIQGKLNQGH